MLYYLQCNSSFNNSAFICLATITTISVKKIPVAQTNTLSKFSLSLSINTSASIGGRSYVPVLDNCFKLRGVTGIDEIHVGGSDVREIGVAGRRSGIISGIIPSAALFIVLSQLMVFSSSWGTPVFNPTAQITSPSLITLAPNQMFTW
jgi:hypothetical protein